MVGALFFRNAPREIQSGVNHCDQGLYGFAWHSGVEARCGVEDSYGAICVRRSLLPRDAARAMGQWGMAGGFSADGSVRIEAADLAGRERLLRYPARPPFALDRLRELHREHLIYDPRSRAPAAAARSS